MATKKPVISEQILQEQGNMKEILFRYHDSRTSAACETSAIAGRRICRRQVSAVIKNKIDHAAGFRFSDYEKKFFHPSPEKPEIKITVFDV